MGSDKSQLQFQGVPLWQHMTQILQRAGLTDIMMSGQKGISDIFPNKGPIGGLHACLQTIPSHGSISGLLLIPVDMPLISPVLLAHQVQEGGKQQRPLHYDNYQLPLYLPVTETLRNYTEAVVHEVDKRHYSLRRLIAHLHGSTIPVPDDQDWRFRNANTPDEWQRCLADV